MLNNEIQIIIENYIVRIYPSMNDNAPIIYLNILNNEDMLYRKLLEAGDFSLVTIEITNWNHDMSPWMTKMSTNNLKFGGGGDEYLQLLVEKIIPKIEALIPYKISWRGLVGYSLAGLFALYAIYHTKLFSRIACISGSLWYPGFKEYVLSQEVKIVVDKLYLSLGDKEHKTRNPYMKTVQEHSVEIFTYYKQQGIDTTFVLNKGNHFQDIDKRIVDGIKWILEK